MIKKPFTSLYAEDNKLYFNEDSGDAILSCNEMGILSIDLDNTNLTLMILIVMEMILNLL